MLFSRFVLLAFGSVAAVSASSIYARGRGGSSTDQPVANPYNTKEISLAAGLVQQTYCDSTENGLKIGDSELLYTMGEGYARQRVNIYHSPSLGIAVAIEGTNLFSLNSDLHDAKFWQEDPNERYIQYYPKGTKLMHGFQQAYNDLMDDIFTAVKKYKKEKNEKRVTVIGHSLGAAMGLLSAVDFNCRLDKGIHRALLFGLPRVGNVAFANYVDHKIGDKLSWVVNGKDWVPHVAPRFLGYQHPSNQIWINPANSTHWKKYPGQENVHGANSVIPEFGSFDDHQGIYFHTQIGASLGECPAKVKNY